MKLQNRYKMVPGLTSFSVLTPFSIFFSYFGKLSYGTDKMVPGLISKNWLATPLLLFSIVWAQVTISLSLQRELSAFRTWQYISCQIGKCCLVFIKHNWRWNTHSVQNWVLLNLPTILGLATEYFHKFVSVWLTHCSINHRVDNTASQKWKSKVKVLVFESSFSN